MSNKNNFDMLIDAQYKKNEKSLNNMQLYKQGKFSLHFIFSNVIILVRVMVYMVYFSGTLDTR